MIRYHVGKLSAPYSKRSPQLCWRYPHHYVPSFFAKFSHHITTILWWEISPSPSITIINDGKSWWFIVPFYHRSELQSLSVWDIVGKSPELLHLCRIWGETGAGQSGSARLRPSLPRFRWSGAQLGWTERTEASDHELNGRTMMSLIRFRGVSGLCAMLKWTMPLYRSASDFVVNSAKMLMICWPRCCVFVFEPTVFSEICWMHFLGPDSHWVKICDHCSHHHKAFGLTQVPIQIATKQNVQKLQRWNGLIL